MAERMREGEEGLLDALLSEAAEMRSGFCCFPCFTGLTSAYFPITKAPQLCNVFMADRLAATLELDTKTGQRDERGKGRGTQGGEAGDAEWSSPASLCQGFPNSHLGCATPG